MPLLSFDLHEEEEEEDDEEDDEDVLFFCLLRQAKEKQALRRHSRFRKAHYHNLRAFARRLRDRRVPRVGLVSPSASPWQKLYSSGTDQGMVTATGLDHRTFEYVLASFKPLYDMHTVDKVTGEIRTRKKKGGRPRLLDAAACLGLTLMWTRTQGSDWALSMKFGTTGTPTSFWLRFGRRVLVTVLRMLPEGIIRLPNEVELEEYVAAIADRHPTLGQERVWGAMDGLKLMLQRSGDFKIQTLHYNGWTHDHYVTNLFLFAPDGTIALRVTNCPGCMHDSTVAEFADVYSRINALYDRHNVKVVVDSAFASGMHKSLIKSAQSTLRAKTKREVRIINEATQMRQSSEWGMRSLQGSFPRLKDRILYEEKGDRRLMLEMMCRLYNLRTRCVGMNQTQSVYMPWLDKSAFDEVV